MKRLLTVLLFIIGLAPAYAGGFDPYKIDPDFNKEIKPVLASLDSAGAEAYAGVIETFKGLADKYPREWRSYYWQAFANIRKAELSEGTDKDTFLIEAERLINRAEMFIKENAELYLLRAWMLHEKIAVDPNIRKLKYGPDEKWYLDQVYMKDQGNPRYFFLKGKWSEADTSEAGKKETLRYYESANTLFNDRPKSKSIAEPDWGRGETLLALGLMQPPAPAPTEEQLAQENAAAEEQKANEKEESTGGEDIPESMSGGVLPKSLTDEDAGEIRIENSNKGDFKLFNFNKSKPKVTETEGGEEPAAEEAPQPEPSKSKSSGKDKKGKGSKDKKEKSSKKDKKSKDKKKGKKDDNGGNDIEVSQEQQSDDGAVTTNSDTKESKKAKEKEKKKKEKEKKSKKKKK